MTTFFDWDAPAFERCDPADRDPDVDGPTLADIHGDYGRHPDRPSGWPIHPSIANQPDPWKETRP